MNKTFFWTVAASLLAAGCATAFTPPEIAAPADQVLTATVAARGVQIYECRAGAWALVAPEATLYDARGRVVGSHGAGPSWQARDGSRVVGKLKARADAPQAGAIPWLLLTSESTGPAGTLSRVTSIQRVDTEGGVAPPGGCSDGSSTRVAYSADYRFFSPR